ncbi:MAG: YwiC-like family protein [Acidobacteria bacterium]|nr:YwiC-like family protein [Acidobacteriota bacterium]
MGIRSSLKLPREHGAWAMLYVPFVLGIAVAGRFTWTALLLLLSTTALFISRESLLLWWRTRSRGRDASDAAKVLALYLALAATFGLPLIFVWQLHWLLLMGLIGVALLLINGKQATKLEERLIAGELLAICGLTLSAPAAYYVTRGQWDKTAYWLWLLSTLYFASSVFYIKLRIYRLNPRKQEQQRSAWQSCAFYHSFLLLALTALIFFGDLGVFALIAFTPVLIRTFWSLFKPARQVNLMRAGILEIVYSLVFLIFVALSFRPA